jgi:D-glycero-alpha-D-manno-heptose-7-phosphate kinase
MIIVQTPLRISFLGGGTDFPSYYLEHGGCVLSSAIDKFIYVTIKKRFDQKLRVGYTKTEMVDNIDELQHELIRESLRKTNITAGVEVTTMGDIPSEGSGLGSSSTVTIGSLHAMYTYLGELPAAEQLAKEACQIEIEELKAPIGVQDQYIAAYGGLRFIEFHKNGAITASRIQLEDECLRYLNENTMLFFTGMTRKASSILKEQKANISDRHAILGEMKDLARLARHELEKGNIDILGKMLHESWLLKKRLASQISNPDIDLLYERALKAGAIGGKISGAGGGGFLLLYCPHDKQQSVRQSLRLQEMPFKLAIDGSKVIFNYRN